jgi:hypothetical protein
MVSRACDSHHDGSVIDFMLIRIAILPFIFIGFCLSSSHPKERGVSDASCHPDHSGELPEAEGR